MAASDSDSDAAFGNWRTSAGKMVTTGSCLPVWWQFHPWALAISCISLTLLPLADDDTILSNDIATSHMVKTAEWYLLDKAGQKYMVIPNYPPKCVMGSINICGQNSLGWDITKCIHIKIEKKKQTIEEQQKLSTAPPPPPMSHTYTCISTILHNSWH